MNDKLQGEREDQEVVKFIKFQMDMFEDMGDEEIAGQYCQILGYIRKLEAALASDAEPVAKKLISDPDDERSGSWFSLEDLERLKQLPPGTKLYTTPPPTAQAVEAALRLQMQKKMVSIEIDRCRLTKMGDFVERTKREG